MEVCRAEGIRLPARTRVGLLVLVLWLGFFWRFAGLGKESIWLDEVTSLLIARMDLRSEVAWAAADIHPPPGCSTAETYERVRRQADFERTRENILRFAEMRSKRAHGPRVSVQIIHIKPTAAEIEEFKQIWSIPGVDRVHVKAFDSWGDQVQQISELRADDDQVVVPGKRRMFSRVCSKSACRRTRSYVSAVEPSRQRYIAPSPASSILRLLSSVRSVAAFLISRNGFHILPGAPDCGLILIACI